MIITDANLASLRRAFRALAYESLAQVDLQWGQVAMMAPSNTSSNTYGWLADVPGMKEWVDERDIKSLSESSYTIKNRDFELSVAVKENDIEDDNLGVYSPMFQMLGEEVAYHRDQLVFDVLKAGFTQQGYDGKTFFAPDHRVGKATFSNRGNVALTALNFEAALSQMQKMPNASGRPMRLFMGTGNRAPLLVVGPDLRATAESIVALRTLSGGGENPNYQKARLLVVPELSGTASAYWFLLETGRAVKPLILQVRKEPRFTALDRPTDENVFKRKEYVYGFDDRKNAGYAFWQLAYGSTGA
ncbi:Mu-like prophage major head subunit gpT family protein [Meiothermus sp.]|uniref:Mu-like prophage major head subunit gpT family protein n=1 Tax=Meiothermus sp. TaxID=1955249 RepID=UPI00307FC28A